VSAGAIYAPLTHRRRRHKVRHGRPCSQLFINKRTSTQRRRYHAHGNAADIRVEGAADVHALAQRVACTCRRVLRTRDHITPSLQGGLKAHGQVTPLVLKEFSDEGGTTCLNAGRRAAARAATRAATRAVTRAAAHATTCGAAASIAVTSTRTRRVVCHPQRLTLMTVWYVYVCAVVGHPIIGASVRLIIVPIIVRRTVDEAA
jgi:hypothetical protein